MKKAEKAEMKNIKIAAPVHSQLLTLANATGETVSDIIGDLLTAVYPEAKDFDSRIQSDLDRLKTIVESKRGKRQ